MKPVSVVWLVSHVTVVDEGYEEENTVGVCDSYEAAQGLAVESASKDESCDYFWKTSYEFRENTGDDNIRFFRLKEYFVSGLESKEDEEC